MFKGGTLAFLVTIFVRVGCLSPPVAAPTLCSINERDDELFLIINVVIE